MNIRADTDESYDIVAMNQMSSLLADLMTLDLAHPSPLKHSVNDENEYWSLTSFGTDLLKQIHKALLKDSPDVEAPEDDDTAATASDDEEAAGLEDFVVHKEDAP